jgi:tRNA dimethylallyltransferase
VQRVAIVGSTASGKSHAAMAVAELVPRVHLVSVDSMQVYRGMDIGTAKPTAADRSAVAHHCIDLVEPTEDFTVADFRAAYVKAREAIVEAGGVAILVGGTGLYHRVAIDDLDLPGQWPGVLEELEAEPDTRALHRRLEALDPETAGKTQPTNRRRLLRALEVTIGSGRPFSSFGPGLDTYPATDVVQIGVRRPREDLSVRIDARVRRMIVDGLIDEVRGLATSGFSRTSGQALGYKEILQYLDGQIGKDEAIDLTITRTRQFAVRQERWFRRDPRIRWVDVDDDPAELVSSIVAAVQPRP